MKPLRLDKHRASALLSPSQPSSSSTLPEKDLLEVADERVWKLPSERKKCASEGQSARHQRSLSANSETSQRSLKGSQSPSKSDYQVARKRERGIGPGQSKRGKSEARTLFAQKNNNSLSTNINSPEPVPVLLKTPAYRNFDPSLPQEISNNAYCESRESMQVQVYLPVIKVSCTSFSWPSSLT